MHQSKDDFEVIIDGIENVIETQVETNISAEVFKLELTFITGQKFENYSATRIITLIEHIIENNMKGSNQLINVFQRHWSRLTESSQLKVKELCERHKKNRQNLGTQVAMYEILENRYLR